MDFITNLPMSTGFNAILVIVCRLTKFALFIPTDTGLNSAGFAKLFVEHVACRFGLPEDIISDRDTRWIAEFWREAARLLKLRLSFSSSHHVGHRYSCQGSSRYAS